jgi:hypothetical protein
MRLYELVPLGIKKTIPPVNVCYLMDKSANFKGYLFLPAAWM